MQNLLFARNLFQRVNLFLLFLISISGWGFSQGPGFTFTKNITGKVSVENMQTDASGNIYMMGDFAETVDFDPGAGVSNLTSPGVTRSAYAAKYDASGNFLWVRNIRLNAQYIPSPAFKLDSNGNVYICGSFSGSTDLDPTAGVSNVTSSGNDDLFLVKLTTDGDFAWGFKIGTTGFDRWAQVAVDGSGNVFLSANIPVSTVDLDPSAATANATGDGAFLAKYSSTGAYIWGKRIGAYQATDMEVDGTGNICLVGNFNGTADFDPSASVANLTAIGTTYYDVFIAKYSTAGNYIWAKAINGDSSDEARALAVDASGNFIISTRFTGTVDLDPSPAVVSVSSGSSDYDMIVAKYDFSGNFLWGNSIASGSPLYDDIFSIATDASSNVYISGYYQETGDFDLSSGIQNITFIYPSVFWAKYSDSGAFQWLNKLDGAWGTIFSIEVSPSGNSIIVAGRHNDILDMDPSSATVNSTGPSLPPEYAVFMSKYDVNCTNTTSSISVTECTAYTVPSGDETYNSSGIYTDTISNANGCDSIITINLTIGDAIAPVANATNLSNITGQCSITSLTAPTATDNCAGTITGTHNATLPITTQGTTVVTWTYNDGHGNTSTQTQNVIINDNTAPVADIVSLANITAQCSVTSLTAPTATDNCAGTIIGTHNATLPITAQGTTLVTWTYNDGHGNTSTQIQNVIIADNIAPVANLANLPAVSGQCSVTSLTAPTATDNCAGTITGTHNATLPITTPGTTTVTWTYTDGQGNTSTQTQNVMITVPVATTTLSGITITATTSGATYQWINCGTGNTPIAGATAQSFTATANGTYAVIVTQNGCSATSACVTISTVGLEEWTQSIFAVYPNPNTGVFKVVTESPLAIQITNAAGQEVLTQNLESGENTLELMYVESGIYFITATDLEGKTSVERISIIK